MSKKPDTPVTSAPWQKKPETELPVPPVAPVAGTDPAAAPAAETEAETAAKAKAQLEAQAQAQAEAEAAAKAKAPIPQPDAVKPAGEPVVMVTVTVPKAFKLRIDHHQVVEYKAGVQEMPLEHADHWYAKANKVEKYTK